MAHALTANLTQLVLSFWLYWHKSANTDAETGARMRMAFSNVHVQNVIRQQVLVQKYKY